MRLLPTALFAALFSASLHAAPLEGIKFQHNDWEIACDNTGTCRAAGYGVNDGEISVLLTRKAGPLAQVNVQATFANEIADPESLSPETLFIDGNSKGSLEWGENGYLLLNATQRDALLQALREDRLIEFGSKTRRLRLSSSGSNAVLLKMDDFQQRVNTPGALIRPGKRSNNTVLMPRDIPLVVRYPAISDAKSVPLTPAELAKIEPQLREKFAAECDIGEEERAEPWVKTPIDDKHVTVTTLCWRGAYNESYAVWFTDDALNTPPQFVTSDASDFTDGFIFSSHKGRGLGDCFSAESRYWNGEGFVRSEAISSGMCSGMGAGGVWILPTLISNVRMKAEVDTDRLALKTLRAAMDTLQDKDAVTALAQRFPVKAVQTRFTLNPDTPDRKPSAAISDDEWQAFVNSKIVVDGNEAGISYTLVDLDNDGKRDLIVDSYVGGTSLYNYTGVRKNTDDRFSVVDSRSRYNANVAMWPMSGVLYSTAGRGADQHAEWIEINGQIYALLRDGVFGSDTYWLLRPFSDAAKAPALTVRYHYDLRLSPAEDATPALTANEQKSLMDELERVQQAIARGKSLRAEDAPVCPVPPGTPADAADLYSAGRPVIYAEQVALLPAWHDGACYVGTLINLYYYSAESGIEGFLTFDSPRNDNTAPAGYTLSGTRRITGIEDGWKAYASDAEEE